MFIGRTDVEAETPILWPPDAKNWLIGKDLLLEKIEIGRRRGWQRMKWLYGITNSMDVSLGRLHELVIGRPGVLQSMELQRVGHGWATELNWTNVIKLKENQIWDWTLCHDHMSIWTILAASWESQCPLCPQHPLPHPLQPKILQSTDCLHFSS